jgi:GNAT superfamily N-acetyltransferase
VLKTESVTLDDFEALVEIRIAAMRESLEKVGRFDPDRARQRLADGFDPANTSWLCDGNLRVGFQVVTESDGTLVLDHLYIHPRHQGNGYGSAAMSMILERADREGKGVSLLALRESRSNDFYRKHGFAFQHADEFDNHYSRSARWISGGISGGLGGGGGNNSS